MEYMALYEKPAVKTGHMVLAFAGWPDAGEAATGAVKYLLQKLPTRKCAEIDPEEFYDFIHIRPRTELDAEGARRIMWPANEIHCWTYDDASGGMLFFVGIEPSFKWKTFANTLVDMAQDSGVHTMVHLGALLDTVPHTRDALVTGSSTGPEMTRKLGEMGALSSNYQGPTGIASAVMESCKKREIHYTSLWGHAPHYLQATPNYKVSHALLERLTELLPLSIDLEEMKDRTSVFETEVSKAVSKDPQVNAYVRRLEEQYDEMVKEDMPMPAPEEVVRDLEQFLKEKQRDEGGHPKSP